MPHALHADQVESSMFERLKEHVSKFECFEVKPRG